MDEQEFERDEQLLEARRLKRLEDRRRRKMQQRIVLGLLLVILILSLVLIVRGCSARKKTEQTQQTSQDTAQTDVSQAANFTVTSTPQVTWSLACSFTTPVQISAKRAFWSVSNSHSFWSTARVSPLTVIIFAPAQCWKIRSSCPNWLSGPALTPRILKRQRAPSTCARSAKHTPHAGSRRPTNSGRRKGTKPEPCSTSR